jgi:hypothetical protein
MTDAGRAEGVLGDGTQFVEGRNWGMSTAERKCIVVAEQRCIHQVA